MKKDTRKYMIYFFGALGGLLYGYDTGVISGALLFINNDIPLTTLTEGLVVSILLLGAIFGSALKRHMLRPLGQEKGCICPFHHFYYRCARLRIFSNNRHADCI